MYDFVLIFPLARLPALTVSTNYERYTGEKSLKMDPKNRISIHGAWRPEPGAPLYLQKGEFHGMNFLKVLSREAYLERVQRVQESNKTAADKSVLLGLLAQSCRDASINDQGKLLIPKEVSEKADMTAESDVMLIGRGIHFEVWNKANFEKADAIQKAAAAALDDLNIL